MTNPHHDDAARRHRILEQIAYFEARLDEMGGSGDCAYEKSLVRVYESRLGEHRRILESMDSR